MKLSALLFPAVVVAVAAVYEVMRSACRGGRSTARGRPVPHDRRVFLLATALGCLPARS